MTRPGEVAGRWLQARSNARRRRMIAVGGASCPHRIRLTGGLCIFFLVTVLRAKRRAVHAVLTSVLLSAGAAHAGRPLQTEDAGIIERGQCEFEGFVQRESADAEPSVRLGSLQISCGLPASTQLGVQLERQHVSGEHGDALGLVGKTALVPLAAEAAGLTLAYGLRATRSSGSSLRYADHFVDLVATVPRGPWLLHGNLGTAHDRTAGIDSTTWALAVERTGLGRFDAMAEVYGDDRAAPWWNLGLRYTAIAERLFIDGSYGRQMNGARATLVSLGLKYAF
jgi:hypothetical protein